MTETVDVNVLVYASNEDSREHPRARALLDHLAMGPALVVLFWPVLFGYLRLATNATIFPRPLSHEDASTNIDALLHQRHVRAAGELDGFWDQYQRSAAVSRPTGNDVPDTHLVALMRQHGVSRIWTRDRDFLRFDDLVVSDPFSSRYEAGFTGRPERRRSG